MTYAINGQLYHHGIKGMKWGIRRFQPYPDGSKGGKYTGERQKKRVSKTVKNMDKWSSEKLYRKLKKQVRGSRQEQKGLANRWMSHEPIGEKSKKLVEERDALEKQYKNSPEYKKWEKKVDKEFKNREYDDTYDQDWEKLMKERPSKNFNSLLGAVRYSDKGREYMDNFIDKGGKDLSLAYLQDLGYDDKNALKIINKLKKGNRTIGFL